ncbi:MAG: TonB family protein [Bacillota bacterium]
MGITRPYYPKDLVAEGHTGTVTLTAEINETGELTGLDVSESSGIDNMDEVALRTIENDWSFESYNNGYSVKIIVSFEMNDEGDSSVEVDFEDITFN